MSAGGMSRDAVSQMNTEVQSAELDRLEGIAPRDCETALIADARRLNTVPASAPAEAAEIGESCA